MKLNKMEDLKIEDEQVLLYENIKDYPRIGYKLTTLKDDLYYIGYVGAIKLKIIGWRPLPVIDPPMWYDNINKPVQCFVWNDNIKLIRVDYIGGKGSSSSPYYAGTYSDWKNAEPVTPETIQKYLLNGDNK